MQELTARRKDSDGFRSGWVARTFWLLVAPALLAGLALRYLVPGRQEIGPGWWGRFARIADQSPFLIGVGLFFLFTFLLRRNATRLPGGRALQPVADAVPSAEADTLTGGWKIAAVVATLGLAALVAFFVRESVGSIYRVTSGSMLPTLAASDRVLVNKLAYGFHWPRGRRSGGRLPNRGDLIVFRAALVGEAADEEVVVKRVVGLPGDHITMDGGLPVINGRRAAHCDVGRFIDVSGGRVVQGRIGLESNGAAADKPADGQVHLTLHNVDPLPAFHGYQVGPDEVFVLGDYRNGSRDSRLWKRGTGELGAGVPLRAIEGRVWRTLKSDRDGHLDWRSLLRPSGHRVHLPGIDTSAIDAGVARCLKDPALLVSQR